MTETMFNPAPWSVGEANTANEGCIGIVCSEGWVVADVWGDSNSLAKSQQANARLIAAAPEMFEALDEVVAAFSEGVEWTAEQRRAYELVRGALSKALGKEGM